MMRHWRESGVRLCRQLVHPKPVEWQVLSQWRTALMGLAMIFVVLFHMRGRQDGSLAYAMVCCGNIGVDMFLFLSGIGLWFSFSKNSSIRHFFVRRYVRIYPAWLVVASAFYITDYVSGGRESANLWQLLLNISINWCFWQRDAWQFWFIPAVMMLYTVAPFYMKLIRQSRQWQWLPVVAMLFCVMVQYVAPLHQAVGHIEIFWSRVPIFLIGINAGQWVMQKRQEEGSLLWLLLLIVLLAASVCINFESGLRGRFPLFLERMIYIPLSVCLLLLAGRCMSLLPRLAARVLAFVGGVSLEIYLIHIHYVDVYVRTWNLGFWLRSLCVLFLSTALAWLLHQLMDFKAPHYRWCRRKRGEG